MSWCAKYARRQIVASGPAALYSRDLLTAPWRLYSKMIEQTRMENFRPDMSRSGMITPQSQPAASAPARPAVVLGAEKDPLQGISLEELKQEPTWPSDMESVIDFTDSWKPALEVDDMADSDEETSDSDSSSSAEGALDQVGAPAPVLTEADIPWYINVKSLVVHARKTRNTFKCGRTLNASYCAVPELNAAVAFLNHLHVCTAA